MDMDTFGKNKAKCDIAISLYRLNERSILTHYTIIINKI